MIPRDREPNQPMTQADREQLVDLLGRVRHVRDVHGGAAISTPQLRDWVREDPVYAGTYDPATLHPRGVHMAELVDVRDGGYAVHVYATTVDGTEDLALLIRPARWVVGQHMTDVLIAILHDELN